MNPIHIPIAIPRDIMLALNQSEKELQAQIQLVIAVSLFQESKLTFGKAVQLAGISRYEFELALAKRGIPIHPIDPGQVASDLEKLADI